MNKTAKYTIILMVSTLLAKLLGLVRELSLSYQYGAGLISDAYIICFSIPTVIFAGLGTAILTCYIPMYSELEARAPRRLNRFNSNITTLVLLLSALVLGAFLLFDEPIVKLFAIGFDPPGLQFAVDLSRIMMLSLIFIGVSNILQGFLQIKGSFLVVGLISVPLNIFVIVSILLSGEGNALVLSLGPVLGYAAALVMLMAVAATKGFRYRPILDFTDPALRRLGRLVIPIFIGRTIMQINTMIDRTLASTLPVGSVSALNYASRVFGVVISVFVLSLVTAVFPKLSRQSVSNNMRSLKATTRSSLGMTMVLVLPMSAALVLFAEPITRLLFERGAFDETAVALTSQSLVYYSLGLIFYSFKDILNNVFYSMQDTRTPTVNSVVTVVLNIILNLVLIGPLAHKGLALATSIASAVTFFLLIWCLWRKIGSMGLGRLLSSGIKMAVSTAAMSGLAWVVYGAVSKALPENGPLIPLAAAAAAGGLLYALLLILLRTREMGELVVGAVEALTGGRRRRR